MAAEENSRKEALALAAAATVENVRGGAPAAGDDSKEAARAVVADAEAVKAASAQAAAAARTVSQKGKGKGGAPSSGKGA